MFRRAAVAAFAAVAAVVAASGPAGEPTKGEASLPRRIVFLGDSITDGFTCGLLVRQALAEAGRPVPVCVDAGVASDTAADMLKRLDRDVLPHRPELVILSAGINDVLRNVTPADYEASVRGICLWTKSHKAAMLIQTASVLGSRNAAADAKLAQFNAVLRRAAKEFGHRVAEVYAAMDKARKAGTNPLEADDVHLNFDGYRAMARAVLDGLGCPGVAVPMKMDIQPMPGLVTPWRLRAVAAADKLPGLDAEAVAALKPDEGWKTLALPEKRLQEHWWRDQIRRQGFAMSAPALAGKAKGYIGWASIAAARARKVYFNTGGLLQTVWLNGRRIYQSEGWTGYHPGKERIAVELKAGENIVVIETGSEFFLSVTEDNDW